MYLRLIIQHFPFSRIKLAENQYKQTPNKTCSAHNIFMTKCYDICATCYTKPNNQLIEPSFSAKSGIKRIMVYVFTMFHHKARFHGEYIVKSKLVQN